MSLLRNVPQGKMAPWSRSRDRKPAIILGTSLRESLCRVLAGAQRARLLLFRGRVLLRVPIRDVVQPGDGVAVLVSRLRTALRPAACPAALVVAADRRHDPDPVLHGSGRRRAARACCVSTSLNDYAKAVVGATLLRRFMHDPIRFRSVRDFGVYCLIAVLAIPALSAFAGAASRGCGGPEYWANWEQWFLGNALTQLIVTPFIFYWVLRPCGSAKPLDRAVAGGAGAAGGAHRQPDARIPARLESPGLRRHAAVCAGGVSVLGGGAVWHAWRHRGDRHPHLFRRRRHAVRRMARIPATSPAETASGLQQFLLLRAAPLYLVAVLLEQAQRIQRSLHESERRFRDMADNAPVMIWIAGTDGGCEFVNKGWLDFTGRALVAGARLWLGAGRACRRSAALRGYLPVEFLGALRIRDGLSIAAS